MRRPEEIKTELEIVQGLLECMEEDCEIILHRRELLRSKEVELQEELYEAKNWQ